MSLFYVLLSVTLCPFWFCNHLNGEDRADCFALFVFLVYRGCYLALPCDATVCLWFAIVVFPDHTHLHFLALLSWGFV